MRGVAVVVLEELASFPGPIASVCGWDYEEEQIRGDVVGEYHSAEANARYAEDITLAPIARFQLCVTRCDR